jgi:hypothetical protein
MKVTCLHLKFVHVAALISDMTTPQEVMPTCVNSGSTMAKGGGRPQTLHQRGGIPTLNWPTFKNILDCGENGG